MLIDDGASDRAPLLNLDGKSLQRKLTQFNLNMSSPHDGLGSGGTIRPSTGAQIVKSNQGYKAGNHEAEPLFWSTRRRNTRHADFQSVERYSGSKMKMSYGTL